MKRNRQLRSSRPARSYVEISSDDEQGDTYTDDEIKDSKKFRPQPLPRDLRQKKVSNGLPSSVRERSAKGRTNPKPAKRSAKSTLDDVSTAPQVGPSPPWQTLPYQILLQIFTHASHARENGSLHSPSLGAWLLDTALVCKTFTEPALTALYASPPLASVQHAEALLKSLEKSQSSTFNYQSKIRKLTIALALRAPGRVSFDWGHLVRQTPLLSHLEVLNNAEGPFVSKTYKTHHWNYPVDLFATLEETGISLRHWRWDMQLAGTPYIPANLQDDRPADLQKTLIRRPFRNLQTLKLANVYSFSKTSEGEEEDMRDLAIAIKIPERLRRLSLEYCLVIQSNFMSLLPPSLEVLQVSRCPTLDSQMLHDYLVVGGRSLTELVLNHNQSLDLSFLPDLEACCPSLQMLRVDMQFFSQETSYHDISPHFDRLLAPGEVPTWPSTLRTIELFQLRKWDQEAAEGLFQSLLNSASKLTALRKLSLYVVLSIPFRERAAFRTEWMRRLEDVFLRHSDPPNPHLTSIKSWEAWKAGQAALEGNERSGPVLDLPSRQREEPSPPQNAATRSRRSTRVRRVSPPTCSDQANPRAADYATTQSQSSQGLCNTVDIRIDNSKQREDKFTEEDFLDEERSGDDDWDEGNDELEESGYAW